MCHLQHFSETLVSLYYLTQVNCELDLIVIVKKKYNFEVGTPPHHAICPPMRLKQLVLFSSTKKWYCFPFQSDSVSMNVIRVNACNSQGKHVEQKQPLETKFYFVTRKEKEIKMSCK